MMNREQLSIDTWRVTGTPPTVLAGGQQQWHAHVRAAELRDPPSSRLRNALPLRARRQADAPPFTSLSPTAQPNVAAAASAKPACPACPAAATTSPTVAAVAAAAAALSPLLRLLHL